MNNLHKWMLTTDADLFHKLVEESHHFAKLVASCNYQAAYEYFIQAQRTKADAK